MHKKLHQNVEFFFGKGVGSKVYHAMNNAKESLFILTPYISSGYIDFLLRKKEEGIHVSLATTTEAQKQNGGMNDIYRKIVLQHCVTDEKNLSFKKKAKRWCFLVGLSALMIGLAGFCWHGFQNHSHSILNELKSFWRDDRFFILGIMGILFGSYAFHRKFHQIKIFSYFYSSKFPFVVVPSIYSDNIKSFTPMLDSFVHAKVYIVDNKDIYIGSVNLTRSGLKYNIESFVKISAPLAVKEIIAEIDNHLGMHCRPININHVGACVYHEAPY